MRSLRKYWSGVGPRRLRLALGAILILGAGLRVGWVAFVAEDPKVVTDAGQYLHLGRDLAHGDGYRTTREVATLADPRRGAAKAPPPTAFYPPGYPMFVAAVVGTSDALGVAQDLQVPIIEMIQALLGTATILGVFELGRRLAGESVGVSGAAVMAFYPNQIATTGTLQLETVFVLLSVLSALALLNLARAVRPSLRNVTLTGFGLGLVALVRPTIALLAVGWFVTMLVLRAPVRRTLALAGVLIIAMVLPVAPWTVRNSIRMKTFVPISTGAGPALCQARNPYSDGGPNYMVLVQGCVPPHVGGDARQQEVRFNAFASHQATTWVKAHPLEELAMWFRRTRLAFASDSEGFEPSQHRLSAGWYSAVTAFANDWTYAVTALALIGALIAARRRTAAGCYIVSATIAAASVPLLLFGDPRYKVPAEPFLAVLAAVAITTGWMRFVGRKARTGLGFRSLNE